MAALTLQDPDSAQHDLLGLLGRQRFDTAVELLSELMLCEEAIVNLRSAATR